MPSWRAYIAHHRSLQDAWQECRDVFGPGNVLIVSNSAGTRRDYGDIQARLLLRVALWASVRSLCMMLVPSKDLNRGPRGHAPVYSRTKLTRVAVRVREPPPSRARAAARRTQARACVRHRRAHILRRTAHARTCTRAARRRRPRVHGRRARASARRARRVDDGRVGPREHADARGRGRARAPRAPLYPERPGARGGRGARAGVRPRTPGSGSGGSACSAVGVASVAKTGVRVELLLHTRFIVICLRENSFCPRLFCCRLHSNTT
jgi:hypothetical protein